MFPYGEPLTDVESLVMVIKGELSYVPAPETDETVWERAIAPPPTLNT